jgi:hypothetical protein
MDRLLGVLFRWLHVSSVALLVGGFFYLRVGAAGVLASPKRYRMWMISAVVLLIGSGLYNLLTKASPPPGYHMWFGIKMLLALHVMAVAILATKENLPEARRARMASGIVYSGLAIFAISSYLRWISLHP